MSDLRERLGRLFACRCDPTWTERQLHAPNCVKELGEDAIIEVAEWLREEADRLALAADKQTAIAKAHMFGDQCRAVERLADSLTRS